MYIGISLGFLLPTILITWLVLRALRQRPDQPKRAYLRGCLATGLAPVVLLAAITTLIAAVSFTGECYGFTDGVSICPFSQYLGNELGWNALLFAPVVGIALVIVGFSFLGAWLQARRQAPPVAEPPEQL